MYDAVNVEKLDNKPQCFNHGWFHDYVLLEVHNIFILFYQPLLATSCDLLILWVGWYTYHNNILTGPHLANNENIRVRSGQIKL